MDLWQLHIFVNVVDAKSFSKAAQACHLTQPTVSAHIKDLEEHFGCRLVDRLGRSVLPTKGGELLYSYARRILDLKDEAQSAMDAFLGKPRGRLCIGASTIPGSYLLPGLIGKFTGLYPEVSLSLVIGDTRSIAARTLEGKVELGIVGAPVADKQLDEEPLTEDEIRLILPQGHPLCGKETVGMDELGKHPFILREPGSGTRKSLEKILQKAGHGIQDLKVIAEMGSTEAVREGIRCGLGISILSVRAVTRELADASFCACRVDGLANTRWFYLITHKQRTPSPLCAAFRTFLLDTMEKGTLNT